MDSAGDGGWASHPQSGQLRVPTAEPRPLRAIGLRVSAGAGVMLLMALLVWWDRDGYTDVDGQVGFLDAVYYATVSLSTTGYGDIAPITERARLMNTVVITPLRVVFVIVLVGTTAEVLTRRSRDEFRVSRWRKTVQDHTVVIGYGTKGRAAARALAADGHGKESVVVVESLEERVQDAHADGFVVVRGDGTREDVLERSAVGRARHVVVALAADASATLAVLTVRRLNPRARIVAAVRESENAQLLRDSGAHSVVVSAETAGRLLGVAVHSPTTGAVFDDLLATGAGMKLHERAVRPDEVGRRARELSDVVVAVVRDTELLSLSALQDASLRADDRVVTVTDHRS